MENNEKVITLEIDTGVPVEFYVLEETKINGMNYLMVTDSSEENEDGECYILKDMSSEEDEDALYEFVEDDNEIDFLFKIFSQLLEDADVEIKK